jgi:acetyl esterase
MRWFRDQYLGAADRRDWRASPLYASLAGAAPAFVLTAGYDPLCDEGVAYAQRLDAAGVQTVHLHMPTQVHGFLTMSRFIRAADTVIETTGAMLRQAWHAPSP